MKGFVRFFLLVFLVPLFLSACRPYVGGDVGLLSTGAAEGYDFVQIFESFWQGMNRNYLFWNEEPGPGWADMLGQLPAKDRDALLQNPSSFWDRVYDEYKPKFAALGAFPGSDTGTKQFADAAIAAYVYFLELTSGLRDGHLSIGFETFNNMYINPPFSGITPRGTAILSDAAMTNPPGAYMTFFVSDLSETAADFSKTSMENSNAYFQKYNFVSEVIEPYLMNDGTKKIGNDDVSAFIPGQPTIKTVTGMIQHSDTSGKIVYLFENATFMSMANQLPGANGTVTVANQFFNNLKDPNVRGVILDLRGNMGGSEDMDFIISRMIDRPLTYINIQGKSGEGRLDYTPWAPVAITPHSLSTERLRDTTVPVVVLTNKRTTSGAEYIVYAVKAMPNGRVIGERTGGACSMPANNVAFSGGSFKIGPFCTGVDMSAVKYRAIDGNVYEGVGIPPDIEVKMERADWDNFYKQPGATHPKKDKQLEAAIRHIDPSNSKLTPNLP